MTNPFIYGKIVAGKSFTNREEEQKRLAENVMSGINSILISPRRWGKSSLMARTAEHLHKSDASMRFCFLDLFNVRTEQEFYSSLVREILRVSFSRWEERLEAAKHALKHITPKFTMGVDPANDFMVSFDLDEVEKSPEDILNLAEKISKEKKLRLVVCLDEFQNISFFEDPLAFQKKLRAHWQQHQHATYCLYGSKRHMMMELFEDTSKPLYKFGDVVLLEKISESYWVPFITAAFTRTGKCISDGRALQIASTMENHPYFVQQLAHSVWDRTAKKCASNTLAASLASLLTQHAILFQREIEGLTNSQVNFLKALISSFERYSAAEVLTKFKLGSSANVSRLKGALEKKEVIDVTPNKIEFIDPLFKWWFSTVYTPSVF